MTATTGIYLSSMLNSTAYGNTLVMQRRASPGARQLGHMSAVDADAVAFVHQQRDSFDLIIADTTDPAGTALPLFGRDFVVDCHLALKEGSVFVRQAGSLLLQADEFTGARNEVSAVFGQQRTRAGLLATCSYLGGWFTMISAVKNASYPEGGPGLKTIRARFEKSALNVHWYSPEMQFASLELPPIVQALRGPAVKSNVFSLAPPAPASGCVTKQPE